ncbi:geranylgeranyl reductase family protein [Kineococcus indalonis]|uniref:geranylgeranyl reductase family protein n=1 Tax=Kineococcus indalonis TaxID=2696566 RepID=UPI00141211EA|nr:geranylgeranyl reductase family protein [Kineococcus indalonis]NAZ86774.1 geranylgeranyl reductase family protein [Kineococcus indalonis]
MTTEDQVAVETGGAPSAAPRAGADGAAAPDADVLVVGAGPAGSTLARYLAAAGRRVLVLEKGAFPREKVCGDGLTPRASREVELLGLPTPREDGWVRNRGLRLLGGGVRLQVPWPELGDFPSHGLVHTRSRFDQALAEHARAGGANVLERTSVTAPVVDERTGHVVGVRARPVDERGRRAGEERVLRAPVVVAADGVGSRLALSMGLQRREDRPLGVAVRTYFRSPRHDDDWLESWLELREPGARPHELLPGYGWVFGVGDGTSNVGLGVLKADAGSGDVDYRDLLRRWLASMPPEWRFDPEHQVGEVRGAALPMAFNRTPHYTRGLLLVGDAGGMVNPFNGEGIAYAMQSARLAAEVVDAALDAPDARARERALHGYPAAVRAELGGYYTLGRVFVSLIGHPEVMRVATRFGLPRPGLMKLVVKLLANLADPASKDATDRVVVALQRLAPAT